MKTNQCAIIISVLILLSAIAAGLIVWFVVGYPSTTSSRVAKGGQPNIIIMLADDSGYGDYQSFGHPTQEYNGVDRMAKEGMRFTNWQNPALVCSPSRASLLTGRYAVRMGISGHPHVFGPISTGGLPRREVTLPEALKDAGYLTGMVGKWHLGVNKDTAIDGYHLPYNHGFDYVGINIPMSQMWQCDPTKYTAQEMRSCFLYKNDTIVEQPINLNTLTSRLVEDTKEFIDENKDRPFFFFLSFPQAHPALFASPQFAGKSRRGLYGDSINEMGWAVEEVLNHLVDSEINKDTLVIFLSDQGPSRNGCGDGGSAGPFRGGKGTSWDGGIRLPAVAWWPGTIQPGGVSRATVSTMDIFPTSLKLAGLTNYTRDKNLVIDGKVIDDVIRNEEDVSGHEALFYYFDGRITAVRYKQFKIHYFAFRPFVEVMNEFGEYRCNFDNFTRLFPMFDMNNIAHAHDPPLVFNVDIDPEESFKLDSETPEIKTMLQIVEDLVQTHKASIVAVQSEVAKPMNPKIHPCCNPPSCTCNYKESIVPNPHKVDADTRL